MLTSNVATVTIGVTAAAPIAVNDTYTVAHDRTLTVTHGGVLANDDDPDGHLLTASLVSSPQHGTLAFTANGTFTYTPAAGYYGTDSFTYQDTDGTLTSNIATVTINVAETAPVATDESYATRPGQALAIAAGGGVLNGVTDAEGDPLTASLVSGPEHGTLTFNADGSFTYTPASGYTGTDSFTYQASDGLLSSNTSTVSIDVAPAAPVAMRRCTTPSRVRR